MMMVNNIKTKANSFVDFVSQMYYENCDERVAFGQEPYASVKVYLEKNKMFLEREYKKIKS